MRIFLRELKVNIKSLIVWFVIISLLVFLAVAKYSAFASDPSTKALFETMPKGLMDMFDMSSLSLESLKGFFVVMFIFLALMGAIAASMWGSESISKEERDKTVEFSLVLPVSRSKVITAKALAALVDCVILVLFTWLVSTLAVKAYPSEPGFEKFLALLMAAMFMIELIFLSIGLLLGCAMKNFRRTGSTATAIILVTYFLSVLIRLQSKLDFLKYLTPFRYFDATKMLTTGRLDIFFLLFSAAIIVVCVILAYWIYNKRDLYI